MKNSPNLGWVFYKKYYYNLQDNTVIQGLNATLLNGTSSFQDPILQKPTTSQKIAPYTSSAIVQYPGLMAGIGVKHGTGRSTDEIKLGFSFDHTTGLPYIPASSIKGLLRSVFPSRLYEASRLVMPSSKRTADVLEKKARNLEILMIKYLLPNANIPIKSTSELKELELQIFEGTLQNEERQSVYDRDIFYDAFPKISSANEKFLSEDVITPHGNNPLRNPIPLKTIVIRPGTKMEFKFNLHDTTIGSSNISALHKLSLFKKIIEVIGLGAKTNVGYGRLKF